MQFDTTINRGHTSKNTEAHQRLESWIGNRIVNVGRTLGECLPSILTVCAQRISRAR